MYDQIQLNTFLDLPSAKIEFGCTTKESEMFYKQAADGILGLNPTESIFLLIF